MSTKDGRHRCIPGLDAQNGSPKGMLEAGPISTSFPISSVLFPMAMRHCTDVPCADLSQTLGIEIGGAMTADTPPQQIKEAA